MVRRTALVIALSAVVAIPAWVCAQPSRSGSDHAASVGPDVPSGDSASRMPSGVGLYALADVKMQIRASDEEWKVIGPKLQTVIAARQLAQADRGSGAALAGRGGSSFNDPADAAAAPGGRGRGAAPRGRRGGGAGGILAGLLGGGRGGGGGPRGGGPGGPGTLGQMGPVAQIQFELQAALSDGKTTPEEIREMLQELHQARQKANADLDAAQKDLAKLLTVDQEAILVSLGYLD